MMNMDRVEYHCRWVIDIGVEMGSDILTSVERFNKVVWIGTEKGQLLKLDMRKMFEETELEETDFFKGSTYRAMKKKGNFKLILIIIILLILFFI